MPRIAGGVATRGWETTGEMEMAGRGVGGSGVGVLGTADALTSGAAGEATTVGTADVTVGCGVLPGGEVGSGVGIAGVG
jgi:hypothetical protein